MAASGGEGEYTSGLAGVRAPPVVGSRCWRALLLGQILNMGGALDLWPPCVVPLMAGKDPARHRDSDFSWIGEHGQGACTWVCGTRVVIESSDIRRLSGLDPGPARAADRDFRQRQQLGRSSAKDLADRARGILAAEPIRRRPVAPGLRPGIKSARSAKARARRNCRAHSGWRRSTRPSLPRATATGRAVAVMAGEVEQDRVEADGVALIAPHSSDPRLIQIVVETTTRGTAASSEIASTLASQENSRARIQEELQEDPGANS